MTGLQWIQEQSRKRLGSLQLGFKAVLLEDIQFLLDRQFLSGALSVEHGQHSKGIWDLLKISRICAILGVLLRLFLYGPQQVTEKVSWILIATMLYVVVQYVACLMKYRTVDTPGPRSQFTLWCVVADLLAVSFLYAVTRKPESDLYLLFLVPLAFTMSFAPPQRFISVLIATLSLLLLSCVATDWSSFTIASVRSTLSRIFFVRAIFIALSATLAFFVLRIIDAQSSIWASLMQAMPEGLAIVSRSDKSLKWKNNEMPRVFSTSGPRENRICFYQYNGNGEECPCDLALRGMRCSRIINHPSFLEQRLGGVESPPEKAQWRRVETTSAPIRFGGSIIAALECVRDATSREVLREATERLQQSVEEQDILKVLAESVYALGYKRCRIYLLSPDMRYLIGAYSIGMGNIAFNKLKIPRAGEPYSERTEISNKPQVYHPVPDDLYRCGLGKPDDMPWIEAPLKRGSEYYGKISLDNLGHPNKERYRLTRELEDSKRDLLSEELSVLYNLTVQASLALQNARARSYMSHLLEQYVHYSVGIFGLLVRHAEVLSQPADDTAPCSLRSMAYDDIHSINAHMGSYGRAVLEFCNILRTTKPAALLRGELLNLFEITKEVIGNCSFLAREHKVAVCLNCDNSLVANIDGIAVRQILFILLTNAIRAIGYQQEPAPTGRVSIEIVKGHYQEVCLSVRDNGPGVPIDIERLLFSQPVRGGAYEGLGLGLQVINQLAKLHGGHAELRSNERHTNVEFRITVMELPLRRPNE